MREWFQSAVPVEGWHRDQIRCEFPLQVQVAGDFPNSYKWFSTCDRDFRWSFVLFQVDWGSFVPKRLSLKNYGGADRFEAIFFWDPFKRRARRKRRMTQT